MTKQEKVSSKLYETINNHTRGLLTPSQCLKLRNAIELRLHSEGVVIETGSKFPCAENNIGNMDALQAEEFFNAVKADLKLSDFGFGITTAGTICMGDRILIDERDLHYPWFTKQLILHEIAHHLSQEDDRHGTRFHKKYAELVNRFLAGYTIVPLMKEVKC